MQTPIKYALGALAIAAAFIAAPMTTADYIPAAVGHHEIGDLDPLLGVPLMLDTFNSCDYNDPGTAATYGTYDLLVDQDRNGGYDYDDYNPPGYDQNDGFFDNRAGNAAPLSYLRAGDQGIFNSCVYINPGEWGYKYIIVMNGIELDDGWLFNDDCSKDYPPESSAVCGMYSHHADALSGYVVFYDAALNPLVDDQHYTGCGSGGPHDIGGTVPTDAAYMLVGSGAYTLKVTWWYYSYDYASYNEVCPDYPNTGGY